MTQPSILYGLFLAVLFLVYWLLPNQGPHPAQTISQPPSTEARPQPLRLWLILIASLFFYASLPTAEYIPLLLVLIAMNFFIGKMLSAPLDWRIPNEAWQYAQVDWAERKAQLLGL
ncbi:MAG: hypothetical protein WA949_08625, partial [Phormidesmis sp.]